MIEETLPLHDMVAQMNDEPEAIIQHSTDQSAFMNLENICILI